MTVTITIRELSNWIFTSKKLIKDMYNCRALTELKSSAIAFLVRTE